MKQTKFLLIGILACGLLAIAGAVRADVVLSGYNSFYVLDAGDGDGQNGTYTVNDNLVLDSTASINCNDNATDQPPGPVASGASACNIVIVVHGDLTMQAGSKILAENQVGGGDGGNITITVDGNVLLQGGAPAGALISSRKTAGAGDTGVGGNIAIHAGDYLTCTNTTTGDVTIQSGAQILADSPGNPGDIEILSGHTISIDGLVSSNNTTTVGRGGRITIIACCGLTEGPSGIISSRGRDGGADLVHLEACDVTIQGLVESTGPGHGDTGSIGSNACNDANHPLPAGAVYRACVEIWSGNTVTIDASLNNAGQVNADTAQSGGTSGRGWIDIYANGNITITGDPNPPFAVHANQFVTNAHGGLITIKSKLGGVNASNLAVQASAANLGGSGGSITIESALNAVLDTAYIEALGDYVPTIGFGGNILVQAFSPSSVSWQNGTGDVRPTGSTTSPAANKGKITLHGCPVTTTGTSFLVSSGAQQNPVTGACPAGSPTIPDPAGATLASRIACLTSQCGLRELPPPFCVKAPVRAVLDPVSGQFPGNQGPDHVVRVDLGESIQDELDKAKVPGYDAAHNNDGYIIIGVSAHADHSLGGDTFQGALIDGNYELPFALFGCSVTMHSSGAVGHIAAGATAPDNPPLSGLNIFVMDLHGSDGTYGWLIEGDGRSVRNTYGKNSGTGVAFLGNNNLMHNGQGTGNSGVGLLIQGDGNYVTDTDVFSNGSHGVQVIGNNNQILKVDAGDTGKGNGGDGANVSGTGNTLQEIDAFANKGWGFNVSGGTGNILNKNVGGDRGKGNSGGGFLLDGSATLLQNTAIGNTGDGFKLTSSGWNLKNNISGGTGSGTPNTGCQFRFTAAGNVNQGGNKFNGTNLAGNPIPVSKFPAACP